MRAACRAVGTTLSSVTLVSCFTTQCYPSSLLPVFHQKLGLSEDTNWIAINHYICNKQSDLHKIMFCHAGILTLPLVAGTWHIIINSCRPHGRQCRSQTCASHHFHGLHSFLFDLCLQAWQSVTPRPKPNSQTSCAILA